MAISNGTMTEALPPVYGLPPDAYFCPDWFEREVATVLATAWHRIDHDVATTTSATERLVVDHWEGIPFGSQDPTRSLIDAFAGLADDIGSFHPSQLTEVGRADLTGAFNWKLFIENHIDVLHLWYLHDTSLADFDHARFEHRPHGPNWASYEPVRHGRERFTADQPVIGHLTERDRRGLGAHLLFPTTPMASSATFFITYRALPIAPEETTIQLRVLAEPGAVADELVASARSFIEEDMDACARIQAAIRSRHFEVGPLARDHEAPIAAFHHNLLAHIVDARPETAPR